MVYPTDSRTNPRNFCERILKIDSFENLSFFELAILEFRKNASSHETQSKGGVLLRTFETS